MLPPKDVLALVEAVIKIERQRTGDTTSKIDLRIVGDEREELGRLLNNPEAVTLVDELLKSVEGAKT
jgi:hypothetical protein